MIYFDHASTVLPKDKRILKSFCEASSRYANAGRGAYEASLQASRLLYQTREDIKRFVDCKDGITVFTYGSTHGLNLVLQGFLNKDDHVIFTSLEHQSVLRPLYLLEEKGIQIDCVTFDEKGCIHVEDVKRLWKSNTKMLICTYASNVLGTIQPIQELSTYVHKQGGFMMVDAAQAIGYHEVSMDTCGIDILVFSGHKGLQTPRGIGAVVLAKPLDIRPLMVGGSGFSTFDKRQPSMLPERLEAGTLPIELIASLQTAINLQNNMKVQYAYEMTIYFIKEISKIEHIEIACADNLYRVPIVSLRVKGYTSEEIEDILFQTYGICVRSGMHCAPLVHSQLKTQSTGMVRFSFHHSNTKEEVDMAIHALYELVGKEYE